MLLSHLWQLLAHSIHEGGLEGLKKCGLFIKADRPFLAASPDGLFKCKCCPPATIEVKCPFFVRKEDISKKEIIGKVNFLEDCNGEPQLKRSHKHYTQVQFQMWVTNTTHCFFVVWTDGHDPLIERINLDLNYILPVINNATIFYKTYVLPCILGYRDIFHCPNCDKVIQEEPEVMFRTVVFRWSERHSDSHLLTGNPGSVLMVN